AKFAIDGVRRRQQRARRLAAQNVLRVRRFEQISRIRLPALELLHAQAGRRIRQRVREIAFQPRHIERVSLAHGDRPGRIPLRVHTTDAPPSTAMAWPVMCRAAALASSTTSPSRSRASPSWRSGVEAMTSGAILSSAPCDIFEGINPGQMAFTVM